MKYVLVTGANGGMGKATVDMLVKEGFHVFALDYKMEYSSPSVTCFDVDVTSLESITLAFEKISKITDNLFAIVHYAGIYMMNSLVEMSEEDFVKIFNVNLFGVYRINKTFLPLLNDCSKIIITSSELAPIKPLPFTGIYAVTKGALDKYAHSLNLEMQLNGISVVTLRPGAVKTGLLGQSSSQLENFCSNTKLYDYNAKKFRKIVNAVQSKNVPPEKIAKLTLKILKKKKPRPTYSINRNFLLLLYNLLPEKLQVKIIKKILK